ncbi:MAG: hypothetical protein HFJ84_06830 [Clostridiales bacterium]|nr:hypothetical protein [Clostridiales bacterium]
MENRILLLIQRFAGQRGGVPFAPPYAPIILIKSAPAASCLVRFFFVGNWEKIIGSLATNTWECNIMEQGGFSGLFFWKLPLRFWVPWNFTNFFLKFCL